MKDLGAILSGIDRKKHADKYLSREFQRYGLYLAERLGDMAHKALYIKLAKEHPRELLDRALSFALDARARSRARLFMWKLKKLLTPAAGRAYN
jgi:hypothetical protein